MFSQNKNIPSVLMFVKCCDCVLILAFFAKKWFPRCNFVPYFVKYKSYVANPKNKQTTENNFNKVQKPSVFGKQETSQFPS